MSNIQKSSVPLTLYKQYIKQISGTPTITIEEQKN